MGLRDWLAERRERTAARRDRVEFSIAMEKGDYEGAVEIANGGNIDENLVREAGEKAKIVQYLQNGSEDLLAEKLDKIIEEILSDSPDGELEISEGLVWRAQIRKHLDSGNVSGAVDLASRIGDGEIQSQVYRIIAAFIAEDKPSEAQKIIMNIKNSEYREEELRNLCFSRAILGDFATAYEIMKVMQPIGPGELSYKLGELVKGNLFKAIISESPERDFIKVLEFVEKYQSKPEEAPSNVYDSKIEKQIPLTLLQCSLGQYSEAVDMLESIPVYSMENGMQFQRGLYFTFATSIAYAGKLDKALQLLSGYSQAPLIKEKGYLLSHFPCQIKHIKDVAKEADKAELDNLNLESAGSALGMLTLELAILGNFDNAVEIVALLQNSELRQITMRHLIDFIYISAVTK